MKQPLDRPVGAAHRLGSRRAAAGLPPGHERASGWRCAFDSSGSWALLIDAQGRNIAEVHRPALAVGPQGRVHTFSQAVQLMAAAPRMHALLQEIAASEDAPVFSGPGGLQERLCELLLALPP